MMKKLLIAIGCLAVLLVLALGAALWFVGSILKAGVEQAGPAVTKVSVKLDGADLSILNGKGSISGFILGNPEGFQSPEAIKVGKVSLSVKPSSIFSDKIVIRSLTMESPEITYEAALKGSNLGKILDNLKAAAGGAPSTNAPTPAASAKAQKKLEVDEFVITGARVHVAASVLGGQGAALDLPEIRLSNLGTGPDGITAAELSTRAFSALLEATMKAVAGNVGNLSKEASEKLKGLGGDAAGKAQKAVGGLGDLFKKK